MRKQIPLRFLLIVLLLLPLPLTARATAADQISGIIQIENRDDAEDSFSCDVKLSGARIQGAVFAVLFAESGQMKRASEYSPGESIRVTLRDVAQTDYIKILWMDVNCMPLANPAVLRMGGNKKDAYEDFAKQLSSLRAYHGADASSDKEAPYALARLLVSCESLPDLSDYKDEVTTLPGPDNLHILQFYRPAKAEQCEKYLRSCPSVRYVEPDAVMTGGAADAELFPEPYSWGVSVAGIGEYAENLRQRSVNRSVVVAVVDSGVEAGHPLLRGRLLDGYDFIEYDDIPQDEHGHGSHVSGTIADCTRGTDVKIMPVRVLDAYASGSYLSIANGIRYAAGHGANIINLSLGSTRHSQTIDDAVIDALSKNVTVVVAAGNKNGNVQYFCPAHMEDCLTVAATDRALKRFELSNYGEAVDIAAPGVDIVSSTLGGRYEKMSGTSMAAPHVSAAAALLMCDRGTGQTPFQISSLIRGAAADLGEPGEDVYFGAGFLNMRPFIRHDLYALLYADGELVFQRKNKPDSDREPLQVYPVSASRDAGGQYAAWYERRADIRSVTFAEPVRTSSAALWFYGCENLTEVRGLENLDPEELTDISQMFSRCTSLKTLDLSGLDTRNVENMSSMFLFCENLIKVDLTGWNTERVTDTREMFMACAALKTVYASESFKTDGVANSDRMFRGCGSLVGGSGTKYDDSHTDKAYARIDGGADAPGYFTDKNAPTPSGDIYAVLYGDGELVFQNNNRTGSARSVAGVYKVDSGDSRPWSGQRDRIVTVTFADKIRPQSTAYWFSGCQNMTDIRNIENLDTSQVTDMRRMFSECKSLTELDLRSFDTSNVRFMGGEHLGDGHHSIYGMFYYCANLKTLNLGGWDTRKVSNMGLMFDGCGSLESLNLSGWNTGDVTEMCMMFAGCSKLKELDLSGFDTKNVIYMDYMFSSCRALTSLDLSRFDTSKVVSMRDMFYNCGALRTIYTGGAFVTESVSSDTGMFSGCGSLVGGNGTKYDDVHKDKAYARVDGGASAPGYFTDEKNAKDIYAVLYADGELVFQKNSGTDSVRTVTDVYQVDKSFSSDTSVPWYGQRNNIVTVTFADRIQPQSTANWFSYCWRLADIRNIENLDTSHVTDMRRMFAECASLTELDLRSFDTSNVRLMGGGHLGDGHHSIEGMFAYCSNLKKADLSGWDTRKVTNMGLMFAACKNLESLNLGGWDTGAVTEMCLMFAECAKLTELDLSGFDTKNVVYMDYMFNSCRALTSLDLSRFDTSKVASMHAMFDNCGALRKVYVSDSFVTESVSSSEWMFNGCTSLVGGSGTKYDYVHRDKEYARVDGDVSAPGYFSRKS